MPELNLYDRTWPIWTYQEQMPPAKFVFDDPDRQGAAIDSLVSGGCIVSGSTVKRSILFTNVKVHDHCRIEDSVVLPGAEIGPQAIVRNAIIDKRCRIPEGMTIGVDPIADARRFEVTEKGRVLVVPEMLERLMPGAQVMVTSAANAEFVSPDAANARFVAPGAAAAALARGPVSALPDRPEQVLVP